MTCSEQEDDDDRACARAEREQRREELSRPRSFTLRRRRAYAAHPVAWSSIRTSNGCGRGGANSNVEAPVPDHHERGRRVRVDPRRGLGEAVRLLAHLHVEHREGRGDVEPPAGRPPRVAIRPEGRSGRAAWFGATRKSSR